MINNEAEILILRKTHGHVICVHARVSTLISLTLFSERNLINFDVITSLSYIFQLKFVYN